MRNICIILVIITIFTVSCAGNTIVKGQIKDIDTKLPLYGATVNIRLTVGYEFFALTDSAGVYEINISGDILEKDYDIQISARDFYTVNGILRIKKNTLGNFYMKRKAPLERDTTKSIPVLVKAEETSPLSGFADNNLVFLIDVSSSMNDSNRLPLLKKSMKYLVQNFRNSDRITLLTFSSGVKEILPPTSVKNAELIYAAIDQLKYESSSNAGIALDFAYKSARNSYIQNGNNKIILATDGIFTSGEKDYKKIQKLIDKGNLNNIALTIFLFGNSSEYVTSKLSKLTQKGNGHLRHIPTTEMAEYYMLEEAKSVHKP